MSRIKLAGGFSLIPEGVHVFRIESVDYKEKFGKIEIRLVTEEGQSHVERFKLINDNGTTNEGAVKAFSYFARIAMNDMSINDIDPQDLVGHYIESEVTHDVQQSNNDPEKTVTFVHLGNKWSATGFNGVPEEPAPSVSAKKDSKSVFDILNNLGG